jgi:hypothetical protein
MRIWEAIWAKPLVKNTQDHFTEVVTIGEALDGLSNNVSVSGEMIRKLQSHFQAEVWMKMIFKLSFLRIRIVLGAV